MDCQNLLKVAAAVALGVGTCTLVALQGHAQNSAGRPLSWREAVPGVPAWPLICILAGLTVVAMHWLYKLLFCPLELLRAPEDVGYIAEDGRSQAQAANLVRRRKKTGKLPPVYPNGWYRVLDSHLLQRGVVKNVSVLGEQVAVFRGQTGKAHVVDAYCPHLGANLAVGGQVLGDCIECPFHGWKFQGSDGKCVQIPYAQIVPDFAKVHRWPSCEVNGLILVWFHCDGKDPEWTVPEQEEITQGKWVYRGRTEHFINAHIQEIPENAADVAHLGHLHTPSITSGVDLRYINSKTWGFLRHDWKVRWEPESEPNQHCSQMFVQHSLTVFGLHFSLLDIHVVARQVGPGLVFLLFNHSYLGRGVLMHCVTPVEPLLQCVTHTMFYQSNMLPVVPKLILKAESIQFERDVMIWNNKKYVAKPLLVKEDQAIQKHRRWFSQFYSENSPQLNFQHDTLDF